MAVSYTHLDVYKRQGQHMVESVFPQTNSNDGTVYYLTMDKTVDEYKGSVQELSLIHI